MYVHFACSFISSKIIFNYKECSEIAKHLNIKPTLHNLEKESKDVIQSSKPSNPIISVFNFL